MDNTKDPVRVLREALEQIAVRMPDSIMSRIANDALAMTAAIPHSETVAAGEYEEADDGTPTNAELSDPVFARAYIESANHTINALLADNVRLKLAAPVAAPVPEAKAEQVYQWLVRASKCGMQNIEMSARDLMDYYEGAEPEAAPAVKHEASELPEGLEIVSTEWANMARRTSCANFASAVAAVHNPWEQAILDACCVAFVDFIEGEPKKTLDRLIAWHVAIALDPDVSDAAPPIAVQGSIGDDEKFERLALKWDKSQGDAAIAAWAALVQYIDSRSPVAAAPDTYQAGMQAACDGLIQQRDAARNGALEEAANMVMLCHDEQIIGQPEAIEIATAIRALSAAAPSADAKGEHDADQT